MSDLRWLLEQVPAGVVLCDHGRLHCSRAVVDLLGYAASDLTTADAWQQKVLPSSASLQLFLEHRECGDGRPRIFGMMHRDGQVRHIEVCIQRDDRREVWLLQDVNARVQALFSKEDDFRKTFENAPVAMVVLDVDGRIVHVNRAMEWLTGRTREELLGATVGSFMHPDDVPTTLSELQRLTDGSADCVEARGRQILRDGSCHWFRGQGAAIRDANGRLESIVVACENITEQKQAADEMAAGESRLREAQAIASVGSFHWEVATDRITWSDELYRIYGLAPQQFAATFEAYMSFVHPASRESVRRAVHSVVTSGKSFEHEYRINRADGQERWVFARGRPIFDAAGHVCGLEGICQDITDRKSAEEVARKLLSFREAVIHTAAEGVCVCHAIAEPPGTRVVLWNERMREMTGFAMEEVNRFGWPAIVFPDSGDCEQALARLQRMRQGDHLCAEEWVMTRKDGAKRVVAISTSHVEIDGEQLAAVALVQDITDRKRAEEEHRRIEQSMLQAQKLESIGVLAGGIAHDFNNLLTSILGYTALARQELSGDSKPSQLLAESEKAVHLAADLTQKLLAYAGQGRFVLELVDLSELVRDTRALLQPIISRQAEFEVELSTSLPAIEVDATQVRQVVMNLITNAVEALDGRTGQIQIRTGVRRLDHPAGYSPFVAPNAAAGEYVFVEIRDTGCGMDDATIARIFDPFYSTKFTGRGLGLAAVLGIMRSHNGVIRVSSTLGSGSCFEVLFPSAGRPAADEPQVRHPVESVQGNGLILVIEDEASVRQVARILLEHGGYRVVEAADGVEGLEAYARLGSTVTAILLDLTMPRMSGLDVLRELRNRDRLLPVVVMTGYHEEEVRARLRGAEPVDIVTKPFNSAGLLTTVNRLIGEAERRKATA